MPSPCQRNRSVDRPSVLSDLLLLLVPELFGGHLLVMFMTQVAGVIVVVGSALRERGGVIDDIGQHGSFWQAHLAQVVGSL